MIGSLFFYGRTISITFLRYRIGVFCDPIALLLFLSGLHARYGRAFGGVKLLR